MSEPKPMRYNLMIYFGSFKDDSAGIESSTPFVPLHVGDYLDVRLSSSIMAPGVDLRKDQAWQVTAVKHSFQDLRSHISQYVDVCVAVVTVEHQQD